MKRILLYGELEKRFGKEHVLSVKNAAEALRALTVTLPGFSEFMTSAHNYGIGFRIFVGGSSLKEYSDTALPCGEKDVIRFVPVIMGSGGGFFKIFLGAVLITGGILLAPVSGGLSTGMISAGVGLVIGGVGALLTKPPSTDLGQGGTRKNSFLFNGPVNTTTQGGPVPVGYGRLIIGSVVVSAGIETYET